MDAGLEQPAAGQPADLVERAELRRRVFPWAVGYGKGSDLWPTLGYARRVIGGMKHEEKWVGWQKLKIPDLATGATRSGPHCPAPAEFVISRSNIFIVPIIQR